MGEAELRQIGRTEFKRRLDELVGIYAAALRPAQDQLPGRRIIMERHSSHPGFTCWTAVAGGQIIGFAYGFHGETNQWWHDVVSRAIRAHSGAWAARRWLRDSFEIAEIHVLPDWQARGNGRRLMMAVTGDRTERTVVLSTHDRASPARRFYHSLGFQDLLTGFIFPGGDQRFAIMGAPLPLTDSR